MEIVDAAIHTFDVDNPRYPWDTSPSFEPKKHSTTPFTYPEAVAAMAAAGVDAAVLVIPGTYGNENGYLLEAADAHDGLFAVIGRVADGPGLPERLAAVVARAGCSSNHDHTLHIGSGSGVCHRRTSVPPRCRVRPRNWDIVSGDVHSADARSSRRLDVATLMPRFEPEP